MFNLHLRVFFWKERSRQGWIAHHHHHHHLPGVVGKFPSFSLGVFVKFQKVACSKLASVPKSITYLSNMTKLGNS